MTGTQTRRLPLTMRLLLAWIVLSLGRVSSALSAHPNFTGVWEMADADLVVKPTLERPQQDYVPEAWSRIEHFRNNYDLSRGPTSFCVIEGMPYNMTARGRFYLTDIYQGPDRITVLFEFEDNYRLIRLGESSPPENFVASANGYSTAHWEGRALVIRTTALKPMTSGLQQRSGQAVIIERWHLEQDPRFGKTLVDDLVVTDPLVFKGPMKGRQVFKLAPPGSTLMGYGCADHFWDEYIEGREKELNATGPR